MKMKQRISLLLVISIILSLIPSLSANVTSINTGNTNFSNDTVPVLMGNSGNTVEYTRKEPEVAILNRYTGNSAEFYKTLTNSSSGYNAIRLFGKTADSILYPESIYDAPLQYFDFFNTDNTLYQIYKNFNNSLEVGVSGTFHNHWHTHSVGYRSYENENTDTIVLSPEDFELMSYSGMTLKAGDLKTIIRQNGNMNSFETNPRVGNGEFASLIHYKDVHSLDLYITQSVIYYDVFRNCCMCSGHYIEKPVVAFRDQRTPQIIGVWVNGDSPYGTSFSFGAGAEVEIKIKYDEPIRLADDDPVGKENLYIKLAIDGVIEGPEDHKNPRAYLTKLENDTLYFRYTVPSDSNDLQKISKIDLSPLMGTGIELKQVGPVAQLQQKSVTVAGQQYTYDLVTGWNDGSFGVDVPADAPKDALGFTESTSYITDLAGNAIANEALLCNITIDTLDLSVEKIIPGFQNPYHDVKAMLRKADPNYIETPDKSDTHMGGDAVFYFDVVFNKTLDIGDLSKGNKNSEEYKGLIATTNMKNKDGEFIKLTSYKAYQTQLDGKKVTAISFSPSPRIKTGVTCVSADGILKITEISYAGDEKLEDLNGNIYEAQGSLDYTSVTSGTIYLDADEALVTPQIGQNVDDVYITEPLADGTRAFRFPFTVQDDNGVNASGVNNLTGYFRWVQTNISMGITKWSFEYTVTVKDTLDGNETWTTGNSGLSQYSFTQVDGVITYLYIRPLSNETYSVHDTSLEFQVTDYAGNKREWNNWISFPIDCIWDDDPPTASAGDVRRTFDAINQEGTIEVDIKLQDESKLQNSAYYLWGDSSNQPASNDSWIPATVVFTPDSQTKNGVMTASATVSKGDVFSRNLWVKVLDTSDNELITDMGLYEYNLKETEYVLNYSTAIMSKASLKTDAIGTDGFLLFMVKIPNTNDEYFVRVFGDNVPGLPNEEDLNVFRYYTKSIIDGSTDIKDTFWERMTVTEDNEKYTFTLIESADKSYIKSITGDANTVPYFNGNLQVVVLSGQESAFSFKKDASNRIEYPLQAGNDSHPVAKETVSLRVSHNNESEETDTFPNITFEPRTPIDTTPRVSSFRHWLKDDPMFLSTAEGVEFKVNLGNDKYGWNYEDIDFTGSYIELQLVNTIEPGYKAYLSSGKNQIVVFPDYDYPQGTYKVTLNIKCFAGKDYVIPLKDNEGSDMTMYIDTSPAADFRINSIIYEPYSSNLKDTYYSHGLEEKNCLDPNTDYNIDKQVIYFPAYSTLLNANEFTITTDNHNEITEFTVRVWNETTGGTADTAKYCTSFGDELTGTRYFYLTFWDTAQDTEGDQSSVLPNTIVPKLGLLRNQDNKIAVQVLNRNGVNSEIQYYTLHPVDKSIEGNSSVTRSLQNGSVVDEGYVIFTPAQGQLMDDVRVFVTAIPHDGSNLKGTPQEMTARHDGTYTYPLSEGFNDYYVYSIDKYGNLTLHEDEVKFQTTFYNGSVAILDKSAPVVTYESHDSSTEGIYEAVFKVQDNTLNSINYDIPVHPTVYIPLKIRLSFDKDYSEKLGLIDDMFLEFTLNQDDNEFVWITDGKSPTGIYEVRAKRKDNAPNAYMEVTVKGAVVYEQDGSANTFKLYLDATDAFGNSTATTDDESTYVKFNDLKGAPPRAYSSADGQDKEPEYKPVRDSSAQDPFPEKALFIKFNVPVLPESSWINQDPRYGTVQVGAFPITMDGTHDIKFYDIFGNPFTQTIEIDSVIEGLGLSIDITPVDLTTDNVKVNVARVDSYYNGGVLLFIKEGSSLTPVSDDESTKHEMTDTKEITLTDNATLLVCNYTSYLPYEDLVYWDMLFPQDMVEINISNIAKTAPEAKAYLYFAETGVEYAIENVPVGLTTEEIKVRYTTDRKVRPTQGTGSEHTFKFGESDRYTFYFADNLNKEGSLTVDLAALGVTISAPKTMSQPAADNEKPVITINAYAKRFGRFGAPNSFSGNATEQEIKAVFDTMSYVQDYLFEVNVLDQSSYKIVIMNQAPQQGISYDTAVSANITGALLSGRNVTVTEQLTSDLYIVVVDNAKQETGAENDNFSYIKLKASELTPWFDTTAPTATIETDPDTSNGVKVYISLSDKANDGNKETGTVVLTSHRLERIEGATGELAKYNGWYRAVFYEASDMTLVFHDIAGNYGTHTFSVSASDLPKPVLKVTWSPYYVSADTNTFDISSPPLGPVNTDVKAIVTANTPLKQVYPKKYTTDGITWADWPLGPQGLKSLNGVSFTPDILTGANPVTDHVIVSFNGETGGVTGVRMEVTAPNGQQNEAVLLLSEGVIDKTTPVITEQVIYSYRDGFTAPYSAQIVLTPNEPCYCLNAGKADTLYDSNNPLVITTDINQKVTYRFRDKAGNTGSVEVITSGIDTTPPILETDPKDTKNFDSAASTNVKIQVNEPCTIECGTNPQFSLAADEEHTLSFTENGVYYIKAYDAAGNLSVATVVIGNIDNIAPMISFNNMTIRVRQNSDPSDLNNMLDNGVNLWDNTDTVNKLVLAYDLSGLDLTVPGLYEIPYTATDTAGNEGYATRYVKVFDENIPSVIIDDEIVTEHDGTAILSSGNHRLKVEGLQLIAPGEMEPYTIKICNGIRSEGQMKYFSSTVSVDENGNFTLNGTGFYTMYITTQSRQTYRTLLYVEK